MRAIIIWLVPTIAWHILTDLEGNMKPEEFQKLKYYFGKTSLNPRKYDDMSLFKAKNV